jgi:hypothetical protein
MGRCRRRDAGGDRDLLERYPQVHDGYDRLGVVYEARGQNKQAADCYRKVIEFARQHPEQYDREVEKAFQGSVEELGPPHNLTRSRAIRSGLLQKWVSQCAIG